MRYAQDEIRARVDAFVAELATLARQAALELVREALSGAPISAASAPAGARAGKATQRGPAKAAGAPPAAATRKGPAASGGVAERKKGVPRDAAYLAKLVENLFLYVKAHPGQRVESIKNALGVPADDLRFPLKKLREAGRLVSSGKKQATTYTAT